MRLTKKTFIICLHVFFILGLVISAKAQSGASIKSVRIGDQIWMSENLNLFKFQNGDPIPLAKTNEEWEQAFTNQRPACCIYENNSSYGNQYKVLYNYFAVNDERGLAPKGWHIPSSQEVSDLIYFLGDEDNAGEKLKNTFGWQKFQYVEDEICPNCSSWSQSKKAGETCSVCGDKRVISKTIDGDGNGTNSSGFSALPGGFRYNNGTFGGAGEFGLWWCNNDENIDYQPFFILYNTTNKINANIAVDEDEDEEELQEDEFYLGYGFSVRCIKD